jgi:hypothetical protein
MATKPAWSVGARQGPLRRHKKLVFFACEGLVAMLDEREANETYIVILPDDFKERAEALGVLGMKMAKDDRQWMRQDGRSLVNDVNGMLEAVKEAKYMGDPSDPVVQAYWTRHRSNSKIQIGLHAGTDHAGYPRLPDVALGPATGRTAEHDLTIAPEPPQIHRPPRRKTGLILGDAL